MLKARGFSLSTKFILFAVVLELILTVGGLYTAYSYLSRQRILNAKKLLQAQVDLISKEVELEKGAATPSSFSDLDLYPNYSFQVLSTGGGIVYDSFEPKRSGRRLIGPHPLLDLAKGSGKVRGLEEFDAPQTTERYFGAYRKVGDQYFVLGAVPLASIQLDIFRILEKFLAMGVLFSGFSFLMIVIFSIRMIRPIRELTSAARKIADGDFEFEIVPFQSSDEIGVLSESFSIMAQRVKDLLQEEIQKIRIEKEVHSVVDIQQSLLPDDSISTERYIIEGYYQSATETGGDYWGFFEAGRYLVAYVADATGHGLPSAMLTAAARGCFSAIHRFALENPHLSLLPSQLLRLANEAVMDAAQEELNMTMFAVVYDFELQVLHYANAAHYPAWIIRTGETTQLETLFGAGPRLGETVEFESPQDRSTDLSANDILFLYTDGLLDCQNPEGEAFGKSRLKEVVLRASSQTLDLKEIKNAINEAVREFTQGQPLGDDITFALIQRKA